MPPPPTRLTVLRLPPGLLAVRFEGGDDVLDPVIDGVVDGVVRPPGVTFETLVLLLQQVRGQTREGSTFHPELRHRCGPAGRKHKV